MSSPGTQPLDGYRLLVAEDEALLAVDIIHMLRAAGAEMIGPALSLSSAMVLASSEKFDCAVLDVRFPDGDIDPVADLLYGQGIPLIFVTANEVDRLGRQWPLAQLLAKPFMERDLIAAVLLALGQP